MIQSNPIIVFGSLLRTLENMVPDAEIQHLAFPHSYRGYHEDLALELIPGERMLAKDLHAVLKNFYVGLTNGEMTGHKGGSHEFSYKSRVWVVYEVGQLAPYVFLGFNSDGEVQFGDTRLH
jgi:hypothetical protein